MQGNFGTILNCMDGRTQDVNAHLRQLWNVEFVDTITEAGIIKFLNGDSTARETESALEKTGISVNQHGSRRIAVVAHWDCAGNPVDDATQQQQVRDAVDFVSKQFPQCEILGLWVDEQWQISEIARAPA
jgi:hypothetical protein